MKDQSAAAEAGAEFHLGERMNVQLRLALLGDAACEGSLATLESEARSAGLSGAEIDAALAGRSFEVRTAALLAFAGAFRGGDQADVERKRRACARLGLPSGVLDRIAQGGPCRRRGAR